MKISVILVSMELSDNQYAILSPLLPVQRGNVKIHNRQLLNALLYIAENSCKWRRLPKEYGNWHTIYTRLRRWADKGVLSRIFTALLEQRLIATCVECIGLDSTSVKVHPDAAGALKKHGPQAIGKSRGGWNTKVHLVSADDRTALKICLSPGQAADGAFGRVLLENWNDKPKGLPDNVAMVMDKAYEGDKTRKSVALAGFIPVVPPKINRKKPWKYNREIYKKRNQIERLFRKLKGFRRIYTRFEKLDVMFMAFLFLACIWLII